MLANTHGVGVERSDACCSDAKNVNMKWDFAEALMKAATDEEEQGRHFGKAQHIII
jgi:hypothetical protein